MMKFYSLILSLFFVVTLGFADTKPPKGFTAYLPFPGYVAPTQSGDPDPSLAGVDVNNQHGFVCKPGYSKLYTTSITTYDSTSGYPMNWTYSGTAQPGMCTQGLANLTYKGINNPSGSVVSVQYSYGDGKGKYVIWSADLNAQNPAYASCTLSPNAARFFTCVTQ